MKNKLKVLIIFVVIFIIFIGSIIFVNNSNTLKITERDGLPSPGGFSSTEKYIEININTKIAELKEETTLINQNVSILTKMQYPKIEKIGKRKLTDEEMEKIKTILNEKISENTELGSNTNLQYLLKKDNKIYVIDESENIFINDIFYSF